MPRFAVQATPKLRRVTPGARIRFELLGSPDKDDPFEWKRYEWKLFRTRSPQGERRSEIESLSALGPFCPSKLLKEQTHGLEFEELGHFIVACDYKAKDGRVYTAAYNLDVVPAEDVLAKDVQASFRGGLADPYAALKKVAQYVRVLRAAAKRYPISDPKEKEEHGAEVQLYDRFFSKLADLVLPRHHRFPIAAVHIEHESQRRSRLNVFLSLEQKDGRHYCELVDWTNPLQRERTGIYEGDGATAKAAIEAAIEEWKDGNRYYDGVLEYLVPSSICGKRIGGRVETDGASFWDSVSSFFSWVALGAAIVAGVVTMIAPVPGAQVVSAAIWTSILSSTAGAVINISQRHAEGFDSWREDALDALTIVGNVFAVGSTAWVRGATFIAKDARGKIVRYALLGEVGTAGLDGVMILESRIGEFHKIMDDRSLTPKQRIARLLRLFGGVAGEGLMTAVNMHGTKQDLIELNHAPVHVAGESPAERLRRASDPDEVIDLTGNPHFEGNTLERSHTTKIQDQHARHDPESAVRGRSRYASPPFSSARGMRILDHLRFKGAAKELGLFILVRDGNGAGVKYVGQKGYKAKPETLKAKTSDQPPTEGLVAFHPDHDRTLDLLAGEPPPMTAAALRANPAERQKRYGKFRREKIEAKGYTVRTAGEGFVVVDALGNKFHGDYDLHGVYGKDGGRVRNSKEVRKKMNQEFGADLIRHGAHDEWSLRNDAKAGQNRGPQPPVTVYTPDGEAVHLPDRATMKKFYREHDFDWKHAYGEYEEAVGAIGTH